MKSLIVYDSYFGNTEQVAEAIGQGFGEQAEVRVLRASEVTAAHLEGLDCLIVGSPTRGFRATEGSN